MEKELFSLFPSCEMFTEYPAKPVQGFYVFQQAEKGRWFKIHKKDVSTRDYALLTMLFTEIRPEADAPSVSRRWLSYLESDGEPPVPFKTDIRIIQLYFGEQLIEQTELQEASCAFFGKAVQLVFASPHEALLIEVKTCAAHEPESFSSYMSALESDFYIKAKMYIGKFQPADSRFPAHFATEKEWFRKSLANGSAEHIYTMENLFPLHLIEQMPSDMKEILVKEVLTPLSYDQEILETVRTFFENGFNASVASKKLYIHRNTLQYRLNKFQEITGISLKDFNGALVAYCASILSKEPEA
ncbi:helix-turn-helix domain-containing protein [Planomicrobium chinense]|uniref:PucR family transcriptional regulator n=1 Tax=Planococcus chinensis TaxID=272917 RepID=UPI001CC3F359|nr:helix-turn-helix domain-containing protein [Planococcus chinensis]MBZ5199909.1 helix-turn-helix domain-containing protein [Planococcus chinensis]